MQHAEKENFFNSDCLLHTVRRVWSVWCVQPPSVGRANFNFSSIIKGLIVWTLTAAPKEAEPTN